jgi:hypothetical protein
MRLAQTLALTLMATHPMAAADAQTPTTPMQAGSWEIVRQRGEGPRSGDQSKEARRIVETHCFTAAQLAKDPGAPFKLKPPAGADGKAPDTCALSDFAVRAGAVSYRATCTTPFGNVKTTWTGRIGADAFQAQSVFKMGLKRMQVSVSGKRLGACSGAP